MSENNAYTAIISCNSSDKQGMKRSEFQSCALGDGECGLGETGREEQKMYLHLLEFTYAVADRETVETWLSRVDLGEAALMSVKQYDDEILAVLASYQALAEEHKKLQQ